MQKISLVSLSIMFVPIAILLALMWKWKLGAWGALYANARMLVQLLLVGYVLTYIFESDEPALIVAVILLMIIMSSWIAMRSMDRRGPRLFLVALASVGASGLAVLGIVTQIVLEMPRWFEPALVVPIAGMIFANSMNTVALAAERYDAERGRGQPPVDARRIAMDAALIPQVNSLLAVGLVSLPGMMTGQILSGVDPLIAARYQIMVMAMIFGAAGLAAATYLVLRERVEGRA
jgi:putative ABC transport system permease protein